MKNALLLCLILCFTTPLIAQNAFYRTQKILVWQDSIRFINGQFDNGGLRPEDASKRKKAFLDSINSVVLFYSDSTGWQKFLKYPVMNRLYNFVVEQSVDKAEVFSLIQNSTAFRYTPLGKDLLRLMDSIKTRDAKVAELRNTITLSTLTLESIKKDTAWLERVNLGTASTNDTTVLAEKIAKDLAELRRIRPLITRDQAKFDSIYNMPATKTALLNLTLTNSQFSNSSVKYDGYGYSNRVRNEIENVTQTTLGAKQEAIQPLKNFSFPSQSDIIDAMAIYLAKRVKQEAVLSFADRLRNDLKTDTLLNTFFPETKRLFFSLPDYELPRFGTAWRYAISKDFIELPDNFFKHGYADRYFSKDNAAILNDMYKIAIRIRKKFTFLDLIEELSTAEEDPENKDTLRTPALKQFVNIAQIINKELFDSSGKAFYWINSDRWAATTRTEFEIFWAFINEKYPDVLQYINFKSGDSATNLSEETYKSLRFWVKRILFALNKFQENQAELYNASKNNPEKNWEYQAATYWDNIHEIISMVIESNLINARYAKTLGNINTIIDRLFNVYEAIQQKNYVSSIEEMLHMIEVFVNTPLKIKAEKWKAIFTNEDLKYKGLSLTATLKNISIDGTTADEVLNAIVAQSDTLMKNGTAASVARQYSDSAIKKIDSVLHLYAGSFDVFKDIFITPDSKLLLNNRNPFYESIFKQNTATIKAVRKAAAIFQDIITADGSKELSQVIESYALPAGSYKIKRRSAFSWDLNAYFGVYGGTELVQDDAGKYTLKNAGGVFGISAPIGISFSWAQYARTGRSKAGSFVIHKNKLRRFSGSSHTISLGIIDIGAVVSYRMSNSADKPLPDKLRWGQVLSPGMFYRFGIRNTPLCLHGGVQYAPLLRTINNEDAKNTWRASVGIMMDLPLFNLYRSQ